MPPSLLWAHHPRAIRLALNIVSFGVALALVCTFLPGLWASLLGTLGAFSALLALLAVVLLATCPQCRLRLLFHIPRGSEAAARGLDGWWRAARQLSQCPRCGYRSESKRQ